MSIKIKAPEKRGFYFLNIKVYFLNLMLKFFSKAFFLFFIKNQRNYILVVQLATTRCCDIKNKILDILVQIAKLYL